MATLTLNVATVNPLGDRVLVKVSEAEDMTAGGILLPDAAKEKPQMGEVTQVGPGSVNEDGSRHQLDVKVGDHVLYSKYSGTDMQLGGQDYVLLREQDILATLS